MIEQHYQFKTKPYAHQLKAFNLCKDKEAFALLMEMGTGKSKVALDKACYQFCEGNIDAVLIVAPNGVHSNWIQYELAKHVPNYIQYKSLLWKRSKSFGEQFNKYLAQRDKLVFFAINIDALATAEGKKYIRRFLDYRNVLMLLDESSRIKNPSAMRTKAAINFGKLAKQRLIMTGTPITQSPFDMYAQFKFLDQEILGNQTYTAFKHEYGIFETKLNYKVMRAYEQLQQYKNLDKLQKLVQPYAYRITKDECLDLPDKVYMRYSVELTPIQRRHYTELKEHLFTEINGNEITAPIILTKLLRLQQITGGFVSQGIDEDIIPLTQDGLPKLELIKTLLEDIPGKVIIWARFTAEIKLIAEQLRKDYGYLSTVEYWGEISNLDREEAVKRFNTNSECRFFVGNPRVGGIGLTLTTANTVIYYSNDFSLETRLQSEDRAHRIGQKDHVVYIDIEATDTLDNHVIDALRMKKNLADMITGDKIKQWL
jgi:SNF2 family DNA or RNA helicase